MMAVAAWLVWRRGGWRAQRGPLTLYLLQWALNALWTPLFFGLRRPGVAFLDIVLLAPALGATIITFRRASRPAALVLTPYALWTAFAAVLNYTVWRLNL